MSRVVLGRGLRIPPGQLGLLIAAAALAPLITKEIKKGLRKWRESQEDRTNTSEQQPKSEMNDDVAPKREDTGTSTQATKASKSAPKPSKPGVKTKTASPTGQEEVKARKAAASEGTQVPPAPKERKRSTKDKAPEPDQPLNPKRTRHSRAK